MTSRNSSPGSVPVGVEEAHDVGMRLQNGWCSSSQRFSSSLHWNNGSRAPRQSAWFAGRTIGAPCPTATATPPAPPNRLCTRRRTIRSGRRCSLRTRDDRPLFVGVEELRDRRIESGFRHAEKTRAPFALKSFTKFVSSSIWRRLYFAAPPGAHNPRTFPPPAIVSLNTENPLFATSATDRESPSRIAGRACRSRTFPSPGDTSNAARAGGGRPRATPSSRTRPIRRPCSGCHPARRTPSRCRPA